jgi:hypothetical protein
MLCGNKISYKPKLIRVNFSRTFLVMQALERRTKHAICFGLFLNTAAD